MASRKEAKIICPESFDDVEGLIDCVKKRESVIVDFEGVPNPSAKRMLDFLSGATYALNGTVNRLEYKKYILIPQGIKIKSVKIKG
ncbi:MAG: cell division protein SepF [Christensenellales bacterium]